MSDHAGWGDFHIGDANNYFGIKASKRSDGSVFFGSIAIGFVEVPTREVINGQSVMVNAFFRKYLNMTDSFRDHEHFLLENRRYASAFQHTDDPNEFARQLQQDGYATDPNYANALIQIMQSNNLYQYDSGGVPPTPIPTPILTWPLVQPGQSGEQVKTVQYLLDEAGANLTVDGIFGPNTVDATKNFQASQGLDVDGIIGPITWNALIVTRQSGDAGDSVNAIQGQLVSKGFSLTVSGTFDADTVTAV